MSLINIVLAEETPSGIIAAIDQFIPGGIENIFNVGLGIGAILAVGTIIFAGILYASAGDNASKQKDAREWILAAIKGLVVIAGGFIIISVINPKATTVEEIFIRDLPFPEINVQPVTEYISPDDFPGGINQRGAFVNGTSYKIGDAVTYMGSTYVAYKDNANISPTDASYWKVLVSSVSEDGGTPPDITGPSTYTEVPLLKQGSGSPWAQQRYGNQTHCSNYANAGCGPTSLAMAVLYLTGDTYMNKSNAVPVVGKALADGGYRPCNNGTAGRGIAEIPAKYGLKSNYISGQESIANCLRGGGVVVALMRAVTSSEEAALIHTPRDRTPIFTTGGHYIVVKGMDEAKNRVYINDPAGRNVQSSEIAHFLKYNRTNWCIKK
jgi:hypothetical protein